MPTIGERHPDNPDRVWNGTGWAQEKSGKSNYVPSADAKPKVKSEGYSGVEETSKKSLSTILKERAEKRAKAEMIKSGGK